MSGDSRRGVMPRFTIKFVGTPYCRQIRFVIVAAILAACLGSLLFMALPRAVAEPDSLYPRRLFGTGEDQTRVVLTGDMNKDGALDLIVGNADDRSFVYLNDGVGNFDWPGSARPFGADSDKNWGLAVADIDGDGDLDIVANHAIFLNDGAAHFDGPNAGRAFVDPDDEKGIVAVGDLNGDAAFDIIVGDDNDPDIVYLNDGAGNFYSGKVDCQAAPADVRCLSLPPQASVLAASSPSEATDKCTWQAQHEPGTTSIALGDLDNDGDLDIVIGNCYEPNLVYYNDGAAGFPPPEVIPPAEPVNGPDETAAIALGDLDGDGYLDLVVGNYNSNDNNVIHFNRNGHFSDTVLLGPGSDETFALALGDVDGDGDLDIVVGNSIVSNEDKKANIIYLNDDKGGFYNTANQDIDCAAPPQNARCISFAKENTRSLALGDVDNDGGLDVIVGNRAQQNVIYLLSDGLGRFAIGQKVRFGNQVDTRATALADLDRDGDLDLLFGNWKNRAVLLINDGHGGFPATPADCAAPVTGVVCFGSADAQTQAIVVGDLDGNHTLDVVLGREGQSDELYLNDGSANLGWLSRPRTLGATGGPTRALALGDLDRDGDLDLVAAFDDGRQSVIYYNDGQAGFFSGTLNCTSPPANVACFGYGDNDSHAVAIGDLDGDGTLDLVLGDEGGPNSIFLNDGAGYFGWSGGVRVFGAGRDTTHSVALSDVNGDGALDIIAGNRNRQDSGIGQANAIYLNDGAGNFTGQAATRVFGTLFDNTEDVQIADLNGDGALDIVAGNHGEPSAVYLNDGAGNFDWNGSERSLGLQSDRIYTLAVGDVDGDGVPDIVTGGKTSEWVLRNRHRRLVALPNNPPYVAVTRPVPTANAGFFSTPILLTGSQISITYSLFDPEGDPIDHIAAFYSLDGGGVWQPALPTTATPTTDLTANASYTFVWDTYASGVFGRSDDVLFRLQAYPAIRPRSHALPGPYLWPWATATTFPFRVQGTQVRVYHDAPAPGNEAAGALVYRLRKDQSGSALPLGNQLGHPAPTDRLGYLFTPARLEPGDRLAALWPVTATKSYTLYYTSAGPTPTGLDMTAVTQPGLQTLVVSPDHPLLLFNLDVSLEWDARNDASFLQQLRLDLERTSELIFDWSNGQAALGQVTIYQNREHWLDAHIRIYATNRLRPWAGQGGIVSSPVADPDRSSISYWPGQVRMGATWNRYGSTGGNLGEDWPRALAHELGHYLFYLDDNYLGLDANYLLKLLTDDCPGAMSDPYSAINDEFRPATDWLPACQETLAQHSTGRSDWASIIAFYPGMAAPSTPFGAVNPGPSALPLAVTTIQQRAPITPVATLESPLFYLVNENGGRVQPGGSAGAYLYQGDFVIDLGNPTQDRVLARGAAVGDRLCVYEPAALHLGCETIHPNDEQLTLRLAPDWTPQITVSPVTSRTIEVAVSHLDPGLALMGRLYPANGPAPTAVPLVTVNDGYHATFQMPEPTFEGHLQVWVAEAEPRREAVSSFVIGGPPGYQRGGGGYQRGGGGYQRGGGAPVGDPDGQATLFAQDLNLGENDFLTFETLLQSPAPPTWATVVGRAYRLSTYSSSVQFDRASVSFSYFERDVPPGLEENIEIYRWDGQTWQPLATTLDRYRNFASAAFPGSGVYALMTSLRIPLSGPGWNDVHYLQRDTRPVAEVLQALDGYYSVAYSQDPTTGVWSLFAADVPAWVNDPLEFRYGRHYWLHITTDIPYLRLRGGDPQALAANGIDLPPAAFYGPLLHDEGFIPRPGLEVSAWVNGHRCGTATTRMEDAQVVYVIKVSADGSGNTDGCGKEGRVVVFQVDGRPMATTAAWDNRYARFLPLARSLQYPVYWPRVKR